MPGGQRAASPESALIRVQRLRRQRPVPAKQVLHRRAGHPVILGQPSGRGLHRRQPVRAEQRHLVGSGSGLGPAEPPTARSTTSARHHPVRGDLAARDAGISPGMGTSTTCSRESVEVGLAPFLAGVDQRAARRTRSMTSTGSAAGPAPGCDDQHVLDVLLGRTGSASSPEKSVSVVPTIQCPPHGMTNSTEEAGAKDQASVTGDRRPRHNQVHPLGRAHPKSGAERPTAGGDHVRDGRRSRRRWPRSPCGAPPRELLPRLDIEHAGPGHFAGRAVERDRGAGSPMTAPRAAAVRARVGNQSRVVDLRVVVAGSRRRPCRPAATGTRRAAAVRSGGGARACPGRPTDRRTRRRPRRRRRNSRAAGHPRTASRGSGQQEGHRAHQMRREAGGEQPTLLQSLAHQA